MLKYFATLTGVTLVVLLAGMAHAKERLYHGKTFSEWVDQVDETMPIMDGHEPEYFRAIRSFGTNEIPTLIQWIKSDSQALEEKRQAEHEKALKEGKRFTVDGPETYGPAQRADAAFGVLGSIARPAIPALTEIGVNSHDRIQCQAAVRSLAWIAPDSLPAFITILTNGTTEAKGEDLEYLPVFGSNVVAALPAVVGCLVGDNGNIGDVAADILSRLDVPDATLKPMLTNALVTASAPVRLRIYRVVFWRGTMNPRPSPRGETVTILNSALNDSSPAVRDFATNALQDLNSDRQFRPSRPR